MEKGNPKKIMTNSTQLELKPGVKQEQETQEK